MGAVIERDGMLRPIEIKQSANPSTKMSLLSPHFLGCLCSMAKGCSSACRSGSGLLGEVASSCPLGACDISVANRYMCNTLAFLWRGGTATE